MNLKRQAAIPGCCLFLMHSKGLPWAKPAYPDLANKLIHKMRG